MIQGSGGAGAVMALHLSFCHSFRLSHILSCISQPGRQVAGKELWQLACSPRGGRGYYGPVML